MAKLTPFPVFRAFTTSGTLAGLNGGKLYAYEAGTSTPKDTYTTQVGDTANANPVILDSTGTANVWLGSGSYKLVLKDSADVEQWTIDNVNAGAEIGEVDTVTELTALGEGEYGYVFLGGHTAKGDGGGGWVYWDSSSSDTADNGTVFTPDTSPATGRWLRVWKGELSAPMFGMPTAANCSTGLTAMSDALTGDGGILIMTPGTYAMTTNVTVASNVKVIKYPGVSITTSQLFMDGGSLDNASNANVFGGDVFTFTEKGTSDGIEFNVSGYNSGSLKYEANTSVENRLSLNGSSNSVVLDFSDGDNRLTLTMGGKTYYFDATGMGVNGVLPVEVLTVSGNIQLTGHIVVGNTGSPTITSGANSPEGVVTAPAGSLYMNTAGGASTSLYVKESGAGNTGWVAK